MNASWLLILFDVVYLYALTAWVGSILFFSFGVAPIIFGVLSSEDAARFVRALFPRYYLWGTISSAVALPAMLGAPLSHPEFRGPMVAIQALLILASTLILLYCGNSLTPAINAARDAGPDQAEQFDRLHRRSVRLNALVLLIGLALIAAFVVRPAAKTTGIRELTPTERIQYDKAFLNTMLDELGRVRSGPADAANPTDGQPSDVFPENSAERDEIRSLLESQRIRNAEKIERIRRGAGEVRPENPPR